MRLTADWMRANGVDEAFVRMAEDVERIGAPIAEKFLDGRLDVTPKPDRAKNPDGLNKTERAFALGIFAPWEREPIKVRLAGRTWYTPDFGVWPDGEPFTLVEIKGFMRDDAAVKIKVAADLYPRWRWLLVRREGRHGWDVRQVTRAGIGREPIRVAWIGGA